MRTTNLLVALWLLGCGSPENGSPSGSGGSGGNSQAAGGGAGASASGTGGGGGGGVSAGGGGSGGGAGTTTAGGSAGSSAAGSTSTSNCDGSEGPTPEPSGTPPDLVPGTWKNITPADLDFTGTFGSAHIEIDPTNPNTLYAAADMRGLWRSNDRGSTWTQLGDPDAPYDFEPTAVYLDSPIVVRIDPCDGNHLYATQGVRGKTQGFWVSHDGGETWALPPGFIDVMAEVGTRDMTQMSVDPTNFDHAIVGSHSAWTGISNAGLLETTDGGETFIVHDPEPTWTAGSMGVHFLFEPEQGIGDSNTWMVAVDGDGFWRTTNAGQDWTKTQDWGAPHGGNSIYYTSAGVLYAGGYQYPVRSTDNGASWTQLSTLPYAYYFVVQGDGNTLYTLRSGADNGAMYDAPYQVSPETDGLTWTPYQGGAQHFDNGPFNLHFDPVYRILYSANWVAGLWALRVIDP